MSQVYDGGHEDPGATEEGTLLWLFEDPNRMTYGTIEQHRMSIVVRFGCRKLESPGIDGRTATWVEVRFDPFRLPRLDTILFLQGIGLQTWLDTRVLEISSRYKSGSFALLRPIGLAMKQLNPSGFLEGLVVGVVNDDGRLTEEELKGVMLGASRGP